MLALEQREVWLSEQPTWVSKALRIKGRECLNGVIITSGHYTIHRLKIEVWVSSIIKAAAENSNGSRTV